MLTFLTLLFLVLVHHSSEWDDISKLMTKHPTWSFEVKSLESLIEEAAPSFRASFPNSSEAELRAKISAMLRPNATHIVRKIGDPKWLKDVPATFDAREEWPKCAELISNIEDEGPCHTDAPAVVSSITSDRLCIFTNGVFKERLSQEMLIACAEPCANSHRIYDSFNYIMEYGIPTGGGYKSKQGCLPYLHPPCQHDKASFPDYLGNNRTETLTNSGDKMKSCSEEMAYDRECPTKCSNAAYSKSLDEDRKIFTTAYEVAGHEFAIRNEILAYGPVVAHISLYDDFLDYPKGIYWKSDKSKEIWYTKHIKLIGWGKENGTRYWLAVNNWDQWGPTKVFKIPRGINCIHVEWGVIAGIFNTD